MIRKLIYTLAVVLVLITGALSFIDKPNSTTSNNQSTIKTLKKEKMKIKIWSDIMCPFCYIGKRKLENALKEFKHKEAIEIEWKSYQLNPDLKYQPGVNAYDYLAKVKGQTREWSVKMHEYVTDMAKGVGLHYDFEKSVIANSFNAHRLIQMAKQNGLGDMAEERLFKAYFCEGANMEDQDALIRIGKEIGLNEGEVKQMLASDKFKSEVENDVAEAYKIGVNGVPFFVINNKYAISGAQDSKVFLDALNKSYEEFQKENPTATFKTVDGKVCTSEGECK